LLLAKVLLTGACIGWGFLVSRLCDRPKKKLCKLPVATWWGVLHPYQSFSRLNHTAPPFVVACFMTLYIVQQIGPVLITEHRSNLGTNLFSLGLPSIPRHSLLSVGCMFPWHIAVAFPRRQTRHRIKNRSRLQIAYT